MTDAPPYDPRYDEPDDGPTARALTVVPDQAPLDDIDAERALLGTCLYATAPIDDLQRVGPDAFAAPRHAHIATAILAIADDGHHVDATTVAAWLRRHALDDLAGGSSYLTGLLANAPTPSTAPRHAATVTALHRLRRLAHAGHEITAAATAAGADPAAATDQARHLLDDLDHAADRPHIATIDQLLDGYIDDLEHRLEHGTAGIATGWTNLDALTGGLRPGTLTTVAGRPGTGKTDFAAALALNAARAGHTVLFCSLEMSHDELLHRWIAAAAGITASDLQTGQLTPRDWERVSPAIAALAALPVTVDDQAANTIAGIRAATTRTGARIAIIDYLQLVDGPTAETRQQQVAQVAAGLKRLARTAEIPVVALAQLNRQLEQRADKRPMLSDLRESGAIEADSDLVIGLYRDELYHPDTRDRGVMEALVVKNRHGATGCARLAYDPARKRFDALNDRTGDRP